VFITKALPNLTIDPLLLPPCRAISLPAIVRKHPPSSLTLSPDPRGRNGDKVTDPRRGRKRIRGLSKQIHSCSLAIAVVGDRPSSRNRVSNHLLADYQEGLDREDGEIAQSGAIGTGARICIRRITVHAIHLDADLLRDLLCRSTWVFVRVVTKIGQSPRRQDGTVLTTYTTIRDGISPFCSISTPVRMNRFRRDLRCSKRKLNPTVTPSAQPVSLSITFDTRSSIRQEPYTERSGFR
jgi:hypothetical protein